MTERQNQTDSNSSPYTDNWADDWIRVKVPLPFSLKWVNSYLIPEVDGYTLIDPGLRTEESIAIWQEVLAELELKWTDIKRIILTHQHPDHVGLAGYVQERSGAPVFISRRSHAYIVRLWGAESQYAEQLLTSYKEQGMPADLRKSIGENLNTFTAMVSPQPIVTYIEPESRMEIGGRSWLLIDAPGHANGQLCFYQEESGWMLCGDQVLPRITPNVSVVPGEDGDPLAAFLNSLEELKQYEVKLAFPGHRDPFALFTDRLIELQQHHERRLDRMVAWLEEEPRTAFNMCETQFGTRLRTNPHNLRFGMSETLAHLLYLENNGRITSNVIEGIYYYYPVKR